MDVVRAMTLAVVLLLAAACGSPSQPASSASAGPLAGAGSPSPAPPPVTTAPTVGGLTPAPGAGAADAVSAVRALLPNPAGGPTACRPASGAAYSAAAGCPVTQRLQQRLQAGPTSGAAGGADPVCRCQNSATPIPVMLVTQGGASAIVKASFGFPGHPDDVQFVVSDLGGRWFVDDTYCADPSTSIYRTPVASCGT